jgi:hypothetical protein
MHFGMILSRVMDRAFLNLEQAMRGTLCVLDLGVMLRNKSFAVAGGTTHPPTFSISGVLRDALYFVFGR